MAYLIKRTDQGGGYVAPPGSPKAYTTRAKARRFATRQDAEADRCPENETIIEE